MSRLNKEQAIQIATAYVEKNSHDMPKIIQTMGKPMFVAHAKRLYDMEIQPAIEFLAAALIITDEQANIDVTKLNDDKYLESVVLDTVATIWKDVTKDISNVKIPDGLSLLLRIPFFKDRTIKRSIELGEKEREQQIADVIRKATEDFYKKQEEIAREQREAAAKEKRLRDLEERVRELEQESYSKGNDNHNPPPPGGGGRAYGNFYDR